jgi:hypothetical protein
VAARGAFGGRRRQWDPGRASRVTQLAWLGAWLFTTACGFQASPTASDDDDGVGVDDPVATCAWARHFNACALPAAPTAPLALTDRWTLNTTAATLLPTRIGTVIPVEAFVLKIVAQTGDGRDLLVLHTSAFTLAAGASLDVTGDRPLVIAAESTIEIDGDLDASSRGGKTTLPSNGPGASDSACAGTLDGSFSAQDNPVGSGGGGGGLAATGGTGGSGNAGNLRGAAGALVAIPALLRAGCAGGSGGGRMKSVADGGQGGGAIELAARTSVTVIGRINAGGAGGLGGIESGDGGGGGGSGGLISFDAPTVTLAPGSVIAANGGGGGAGADDERGGDGDDALLNAASARGGGGKSNTGGDGGALTMFAGADGGSAQNGGGGGGGGSVGYVLVRARTFMSSGAVVSPPASPL